MKLIKTVIFSIIASTALLSINAQANSNDLCAKLPGFWTGETHLKNPTECTQFNGCSHLVMLNAESLQDDKYRVKINFTDGVNVKEQQIDVACQDGNITIPVPTKHTLSTSCDSSNHCFIVYDDARFSAELIKK
ncbi:MAG: hypothetical protein ACD_46C00531G0007 [uncultured bacterium]|nr:MAG: hypothetical protein ACD_46C00531G0007 [uncultured bacterium]